MTLKFPTTITKEWVKNNCICVRRENRLLCCESCPVHNTYDVPENRREEIADVTKELGWRLDWFQDQVQEKRP